MKKGWFITFEGVDKAGKSTQIDLFTKTLRERGIPFLFTREPGGTPVSERIRQLLLDPESRMHPLCEALLYAASRGELVHTVLLPALAEGMNVVCDRYVDSSVAYQGFGRELGMGTVTDINRFATGGLMPDLTFFLSLPPKEAEKRSTGPKDRIESAAVDFHERVYNGYLTLARTFAERIAVIDASASIQAVHAAIVAAFDARIR